VGIRHRRALEFVGSLTLSSKIPEFLYPSGIWSSETRFMPIWPESENFCHIPAKLCQIPAKLVGIWPNWPDSYHTGQILANLARIWFVGIWRRLYDITEFRFKQNFFVQTKCKKLFLGKLFFF
jgi:hypothetical protein